MLNDKILRITPTTYLEFQSSSNNLLETLPYYINKDTCLKEGLNIPLTFDAIVYEILEHDDIILHNKCDLILFYNNFDSKYIPSLLRILININNNTHAIHIQRNKKVNMKIHTIFNNVLNKENISNINNNNFITVFCSLVIGTLNSINTGVNMYISSQTHYNKTIIIREIINLDILITFITNFYETLDRNDETDVFYFKMAEVFYSFFNLSSKGILHTQSSTFYLDSKTVPVIPKSFTYKIDGILKNIYTFFKKLNRQDTFIDFFTIHKEFYNKDHIREIQVNYGAFIILQPPDYSQAIAEILQVFIDNYDKRIEEKSSNEIKYKTDIPEKFLDPIMFTTINTPVEVHDVKEIVDKYMIYNHLVFNHTNPFTNKVLTTNELEEYNKYPDVIERIQTFIFEFDEWKLNNKI